MNSLFDLFCFQASSLSTSYIRDIPMGGVGASHIIKA